MTGKEDKNDSTKDANPGNPVLNSPVQAHGESSVFDKNEQTAGNFSGSTKGSVMPSTSSGSTKGPIITRIASGSTSGNSGEPPTKVSRVENTIFHPVVIDEDLPPVFDPEGEEDILKSSFQRW